ncbi:hypothetical protein D9Q98_008190 [Chlorella vulgaris]|uniref:Uncharacterized protein n=1 Tax=Chlorella vulgaris TaxID=3077 RepID=A0A9D4TG63_CHLVU|nr:hypothetical protein D9Q98_008190 [Chlorella vulgaris]
MASQRAKNSSRARQPARQQPPQCLSNLQSLLLHVGPTVPCLSQYDDLQAPSSPTGTYFTLQDLWQSYEAWSAYGCEVPVRINVGGKWQEVIQCYTPHLSGLQLFEADSRIPSSASSTAMSSCCSEDGSDGGECVAGGGSGPPGADSCASSACTSSTASTASTTSDSDSEDACKDSPTAGEAAARRMAARHAVRGSVLHKQQHMLGEPSRALFEFMEVERPHLRQPLHDKVLELAEEWPQLLSLDTRDLHPTSWMAVTWVPIYRIPGVPDPLVSRDLQANFLTFHSLAVPQPKLHSGPYDPCNAAPQPPMLDPIGAAAVAWRTEVARQHLLSNAVSAVAAAQRQRQLQAARGAREAATGGDTSATSPLSPASSSRGSSAVSTPHSGVGSVCTLAGLLAAASSLESGAAALRRLPLTATCLRPFAFLPYKACGATWVDDWNLQRQHLPMIAAAGSWIERRKVQLPDFDFMSQMYRPLPSGYQHFRR